MNLIKSDHFNTFRYFLIVIYNIELKGICKGEKTKGERNRKGERKRKAEKKKIAHYCSYYQICFKKSFTLVNCIRFPLKIVHLVFKKIARNKTHFDLRRERRRNESL